MSKLTMSGLFNAIIIVIGLTVCVLSITIVSHLVAKSIEINARCASKTEHFKIVGVAVQNFKEIGVSPPLELQAAYLRAYDELQQCYSEK